MMYEIDVTDVIAVSTLVLTHPITRMVVRIVTTLGAIASIFTFFRESETGRKVFGFFLLGLCILATLTMGGCAQQATTFKGEHILTATADPISGVYCEQELEVLQASAKEKVRKLLGMDFDSDKLAYLVQGREKYDSCVVDYKADRIVVNPFNLIRD